ncbi:MAG: arsenate reductase ArsC [Flavobacteriales bacterium]|nr:arsenate reductase ArsC [Flavobacteriales bacterium]MCL4281743.1 arsenate reductase ArsC [Flavobacteriales bacterium]
MMRILVLCTGNSCRSQMAEGYLRHLAGGRAEVYSAGIEAHGLNPRAVAVMAEDGIDISGHRSELLDAYHDLPFDHVITVCDSARERCPWFPSTAEQHHRDFPDPAKATGSEEEIRTAFKEVRDEIKAWCREFILHILPS